MYNRKTTLRDYFVHLYSLHQQEELSLEKRFDHSGWQSAQTFSPSVTDLL